MKHRAAFVVLLLLVTASVVWAAGSITEYEITNQAQRDHFRRNRETIRHAFLCARNLEAAQAEVVRLTALRNEAFSDIRADLVERWPALDGQLPDPLTEFELGVTDTDGSGELNAGDVVTWAWVNADAVAKRASPPAGVLVWP